jgi:hypothetical protein
MWVQARRLPADGRLVGVIVIAASVWNAWPKRFRERESHATLGAVQSGEVHKETP